VTYSDPRAMHKIATWDSHASAVVSEVMR
jgi:hypothetical protein